MSTQVRQILRFVSCNTRYVIACLAMSFLKPRAECSAATCFLDSTKTSAQIRRRHSSPWQPMIQINVEQTPSQPVHSESARTRMRPWRQSGRSTTLNRVGSRNFPQAENKRT